MATLETIIEETRKGFHFRDLIVDIAIVKEEDNYIAKMIFLQQTRKPYNEIFPHVKTKKVAYEEFRAMIDVYRTSSHFQSGDYRKINALLKCMDKKYHLKNKYPFL